MSGRIVNGYFQTFLLLAVDMTQAETVYLNGTASFAAIPVAFVAAYASRYFRRMKPIVSRGFFSCSETLRC